MGEEPYTYHERGEVIVIGGVILQDEEDVFINSIKRAVEEAKEWTIKEQRSLGGN